MQITGTTQTAQAGAFSELIMRIVTQGDDEWVITKFYQTHSSTEDDAMALELRKITSVGDESMTADSREIMIDLTAGDPATVVEEALALEGFNLTQTVHKERSQLPTD